MCLFFDLTGYFVFSDFNVAAPIKPAVVCFGKIYDDGDCSVGTVCSFHIGEKVTLCDHEFLLKKYFIVYSTESSEVSERLCAHLTGCYARLSCLNTITIFTHLMDTQDGSAWSSSQFITIVTPPFLFATFVLIFNALSVSFVCVCVCVLFGFVFDFDIDFTSCSSLPVLSPCLFLKFVFHFVEYFTCFNKMRISGKGLLSYLVEVNPNVEGHRPRSPPQHIGLLCVSVSPDHGSLRNGR